jgi:hypothetical protein
VKDEKTLIQIFKSKAATFGYSENNILDVQILRMSGDSSEPVVIQFSTILHKNMFLSKYYLNPKLLTLQQLGRMQ